MNYWSMTWCTEIISAMRRSVSSFFDDRIEIISPGHLPNNLTVEKIRVGNSNTHNPILVSYVAKGLLPYHGLGSGIKRALELWTDIEFEDDRDGCLFTACIRRKQGMEVIGEQGSLESSGKTDTCILVLLGSHPDMTLEEVAAELGITVRAVEKQVSKLRQVGRLRRIGPAKGGHWEVVE